MPTALPVSASVDTFMQSANQAAMQASLALVPGTNVQAYNATLAAVAGGTYAGATSITTLGTIATGVWNGTAIAVANGGTGATDAATARSNLGLGTIATQAASAVAITGGTITGLTDFGIVMPSNTAITGIDLGTTTGTTAQPLTISQVWNNAGATLSGSILKLAVTNTSAAATSKYFEITHGGSHYFSIRKGDYNDPALYFQRVGGGTADFIYVGDGNFTYSAQGTKMMSMSSSSGLILNSSSILAFSSSGSSEGSYDLILRRAAAASLKQGSDSATPVSQILCAGDGSGTNIAGANYTLRPGNGTGTGGSGKLIFQTAPTGSTGSTANTMATALEIDKDRVLLVKDTNAAPSGTPSGGGYLYVESGALKYKGSSGTVTTLASA